MSLHDWHLHTGFSSDSDEKMERVAETAIGQGMTCICITDHYDMGYPTGEFCLDTEAYLQKLRGVQEAFRDRCDIRAGVEMGLQPELPLAESISRYCEEMPFDFVIGSVHLLHGVDPYDRDQIPEDDRAMYRRYFECVLDCVRACVASTAVLCAHLPTSLLGPGPGRLRVGPLRPRPPSPNTARRLCARAATANPPPPLFYFLNHPPRQNPPPLGKILITL